jgi:hypothetical protein
MNPLVFTLEVPRSRMVISEVHPIIRGIRDRDDFFDGLSSQLHLSGKDKQDGRELTPTCFSSSFAASFKGDYPYYRDKMKALISFQETVSVRLIPNRSAYSAQLKSCLWSDRREIQTNAARNRVEFAAEGFDWKNVTEDDAMYINDAGERVHPIDLSTLWSKKKHPAAPNKLLPRPIPRRPRHPYLADEDTGSDWDPVARPPAPSPLFADS